MTDPIYDLDKAYKDARLAILTLRLKLEAERVRTQGPVSARKERSRLRTQFRGVLNRLHSLTTRWRVGL